MCGFVGIVRKNSAERGELATTVMAMNDRLVHRGPDDGSVWADSDAGIALGHRRLSIIDLSPQGRQPMESHDGRFVLVFNGEIYNFEQIRNDLERLGAAPPWRGHSDTEVLLAAIVQWGIEGALRRCVGMFAFALWDRRKGVLSLGRDRMGEKPLYYGWAGGSFVFASEPKAFAACPFWDGTVDGGALSLYLRFGYVPAPLSIYRGIFKPEPGAVVHLQTGSARPSSTPLPSHPYWSVRQAAEEGRRAPFTGSDEEATVRLEELLREAVGLQMVADVPLGAFLSGGIDSSTIVALMQAQSSRPVRTFTVGFDEAGYQEAEHARAVARHLGTDHTEMTATAGEAIDVLPRIPHLFDEPFADPSQIPTYLVSRLTKQHVTVSLSGDAGDELFGGYNRYFLARNLWRYAGRLPAAGRRAAARVLEACSSPALDGALGWLAPAINRYGHADRVSSKLRKMGEVLDAASPHDFYLKLISAWKEPGDILLHPERGEAPLVDPAAWPADFGYFPWMMFHDAIGYLPDDILVKVDRAAMGVSLETRVPMLDHRIVEFAMRLPLSMKVRGDQGKWLLRQVLYRHVPRELIDRPKMGFAVPVGEWLRGPLREWAESLLEEKRLKEEGYFAPRLIREKWEQHLSGRNNWSNQLWTVLMFQGWLAAWGSPATHPPLRAPCSGTLEPRFADALQGA